MHQRCGHFGSAHGYAHERPQVSVQRREGAAASPRRSGTAVAHCTEQQHGGPRDGVGGWVEAFPSPASRDSAFAMDAGIFPA